MEITVRIKEVYGVRNVYPVCDKAKLLAQLAGTKTLTAAAIEAIKSLGYKINVEQVSL